MKTEARDMYWMDLDRHTTTERKTKAGDLYWDRRKVTERAARKYVLKLALTIVGLALAWAGYVTIWNMLH